jgi:TRAP-type C4-dicarboxylate transport system substrate-binding protein
MKLICSLIGALLQSIGVARAETLTQSTPDADTSEITLTAKHFAELVKQKTNGELEIRVFPNGTLYGGDPSACVKQLAGGSFDMLLNATSLYATFNPKFTAIAVPYLFDDVSQLRAYLDGEPRAGTVPCSDVGADKAARSLSVIGDP